MLCDQEDPWGVEKVKNSPTPTMQLQLTATVANNSSVLICKMKILPWYLTEEHS